MNLALQTRAGRLIPSLFPLQDVVDEAIAFLREHEPQEGYFVGFSGGKDSIVVEHLCKMAGVKHQAFYSCTRVDPPEIYAFIKRHYPHVTWLFPRISFWRGIENKFPPAKLSRWCCDVLKKDPSKHIPLKNRVMGIRAEESHSRAKRPRIDYHKSYKQTVFKPIFQWQEWHVWDFIDQHNLPYPDLYDEGFDRIGCIVCPFLMKPNQGRLNRHRDRWPQMYRVFEISCLNWWNRVRAKEGPHPKYGSFDAWLQAYYRGFE